MTGQIYLVDQGEQLVPLMDTAYNSEDRLQRLLADYPDLLAGEQVNSESPRRWLLVDREIGVPDQEDGGDRWSLDHLFLDQDGIPTIVEVKRATDSRTRREVVGQMMDYAANAVVYWPVESLQSVLAARCEADGIEPEDALAEAFGDDIDEGRYWEAVKTNLRAGKVRMIFVVDRMPRELQRIVEFLNEQMDPAEVLAVEIKQYVGGDLQALVPRVIGNTAEAKRQQQTRGSAPQWDAPMFLEKLRSDGLLQEARVIEQVLNWLEERKVHIHWGRAKNGSSFQPRLKSSDNHSAPGSINSRGDFTIEDYRLSRPPFDQEAKRSELAGRLNSIPGVSISLIEMNGEWQSFSLKLLAEDQNLRQFLDTLDWFFNELQTANEMS